MDIDEIKQEAIDHEHLRLLEVFHYISGGLTILFSSLFIFHLVFMSYFMMNPDLFPSKAEVTGDFHPEQFLSFFLFIFGFLVILGIAFGIAQILSGRFMKKRKNRLFSVIVSIPNVLFIPYGTILAIFTLVVLDKKTIKQIYDSSP